MTDWMSWVGDCLGHNGCILLMCCVDNFLETRRLQPSFLSFFVNVGFILRSLSLPLYVSLSSKLFLLSFKPSISLNPMLVETTFYLRKILCLSLQNSISISKSLPLHLLEYFMYISLSFSLNLSFSLSPFEALVSL